MSSIETKEIRGMNVKNLVAIILATGSIVTTVLISYNNLSAQIIKTQNAQESSNIRYQADARYNDLRLTVLEKTVNLLQLQIDNFKK